MTSVVVIHHFSFLPVLPKLFLDQYETLEEFSQEFFHTVPSRCITHYCIIWLCFLCYEHLKMHQKESICCCGAILFSLIISGIKRNIPLVVFNKSASLITRVLCKMSTISLLPGANISQHIHLWRSQYQSTQEKNNWAAFKYYWGEMVLKLS